MTEYLESAQVGRAARPAVQAFTYVTYDMPSIDVVRSSRISNLVGLPRPRAMAYGLQQNFKEVSRKLLQRTNCYSIIA